MERLDELIQTTLTRHPLVDAVKLTGSRANESALSLSDWDFEVETSDFESLKEDLPELTASLATLAQFWDPYSERANYILLLRGPVKVDLIFSDQPWQQAGPWQVNADTLPAIDRHFWDWTLWLAAKQQRGDEDLVSAELAKMHRMLLGPLGVEQSPATIRDAITCYLDKREEREGEFGLRLPRELGLQVVRRLRGEGFEI